MNILGIDTSFESCSVAAGSGLLSARPQITGRLETMATGQAERLMPMIQEVMGEARLTFSDLHRIAVTVGPGSFTGMRIGVAAARALSLALKVPIVAFTSLEVMAMSAQFRGFDPARGALAIAIDARRGQVYFQPFLPGEPPECETPRLVTIADAAALPGEGGLTFAGSGGGLVAEAARAAGRTAEAILPGLAPSMADALKYSAVRRTVAAAPRPLYLRPPDAKPQEGKSLARMP